VNSEQTAKAKIRVLEQEVDGSKRENNSLKQQHTSFLRRLEQGIPISPTPLAHFIRARTLTQEAK